VKLGRDGRYPLARCVRGATDAHFETESST
jgi:hypothetical protein